MTPLVLNVAELLRTPGITRHIELASSTTELNLDGDDRLVAGPVGLDLHLDVLSDGIVVRGTISAAWSGECRRCLVVCGGDLTIEVQELYQTRVTDPEAFPIEQEQLDLRPMAREAVLIEAPAAPLCRPDCAGICPACGQDLNERPCSCSTTPRDNRWAALDALREESR